MVRKASMKAAAPLLMALLLSAPGAFAQTAMPEPHIDTVEVQSQKEKDDSVARHFVQGILKPSTVDENQYAMWKVPICPRVYGLDPASRVFVEQRIKQVAAQVGAPVDRNDPCITDVGIIFTGAPQAALDIINSRNPDLILSYIAGKPKVTHPIQAWYATVSKDDNGVLRLDQDWFLAGLDHPPQLANRGTRIITGITAQTGAATILVDLNAVTGRSLASLADYVALMILSQMRASEECQEMPTIANLLTADCAAENRSDALTDVDIAMLTGLYHSADGPDQLQRPRLIKAMKQSLAAQRGQ